MLSQIYTETGRYARSRCTAARTATKLEPNSRARRGRRRIARRTLFAQIFLGAKGDDLPPVDALGMFYEFRELTPIGRRGDEMIRRLADRLVAVDLLDQAAELLQYQVDHRLEGAARAQVAARLAMVYLANRKPDLAITALRSTRIADLSGELRQQRLLLEARAQSDVGRHDLALDIISNLSGREAIRLRSDIYWAARRWRESVRADRTVLRRSLARFQTAESGGEERHHPRRGRLCAGRGRDRAGAVPREIRAADERGRRPSSRSTTASKPAAASSAEFAEIAKMAASVDTLDGFLREMKARFPDAGARRDCLRSRRRPARCRRSPQACGAPAAKADHSPHLRGIKRRIPTPSAEHGGESAPPCWCRLR